MVDGHPRAAVTVANLGASSLRLASKKESATSAADFIRAGAWIRSSFVLNYKQVLLSDNL
ncbi:hypothetical protein HK44_004460 [Pseudomonas fluorescens HK44]|uniref:Uncharacterized protein n=1 Tax=Pseudomonas fluorescens HK44 TaxID=1042209 RepID=A0A010SM93_PSEFL|nr:hypothetical protein HK44_004460 [Pseudomonas fluorescens HK44]